MNNGVSPVSCGHLKGGIGCVSEGRGLSSQERDVCGVPGQCLGRDSEGAGDVRSGNHKVSVASIQRRLVVQTQVPQSSAITKQWGSDPW